jgi:hypothetical protein
MCKPMASMSVRADSYCSMSSAAEACGIRQSVPAEGLRKTWKKLSLQQLRDLGDRCLPPLLVVMAEGIKFLEHFLGDAVGAEVLLEPPNFA